MIEDRRNLVVGADGQELGLELVAGADVVMENFRPGVFARLGLTDEVLRELNPRLIYASASGYGSSGPMAERPGQDILMQAASGLVSVTGTPAFFINGRMLSGAQPFEKFKEIIDAEVARSKSASTK